MSLFLALVESVYARGLARDVKEQVSFYARGLARDVKEQYFLVSVYTVCLCKSSTFWSVSTLKGLPEMSRTVLSGQCLRSRACPRCQRTGPVNVQLRSRACSRCEQVNVQLRSRACPRCQRTVLSGQCLHRMSMQEQYSVLSGQCFHRMSNYYTKKLDVVLIKFCPAKVDSNHRGSVRVQCHVGHGDSGGVRLTNQCELTTAHEPEKSRATGSPQ